MPRTSAASLLTALLGLAASSPTLAEDIAIVFKISDRNGVKTATRYVSATRACFDQGDDATIVDFATGRVLQVSRKKKQYSETTFAEMEQAMSSTSAQMEKAMEGIPEGLRSKMMGGAGREVTLTKGEIRTIAGLPCQTYNATLGERMRMETCVTDAIRTPFDAKHARDLVLATSPVARGDSGLNRLVEKMRAIEGISLASSTSLAMLGKTIDTAMEATEVRNGPIDASVFETPPGFRKVDSPFATTAR